MSLGAYASERRWQSAGLFDRHHRLSAIHAPDQEPETGELLPETIERVDNVVWATDNKTIFYVTEDAVTKRSDKFFRHVARQRQERFGLRREGRTVRHRRRPIA